MPYGGSERCGIKPKAKVRLPAAERALVVEFSAVGACAWAGPHLNDLDATARYRADYALDPPAIRNSRPTLCHARKGRGPWVSVAPHECQAETPPGAASRHRILAEADCCRICPGC